MHGTQWSCEKAFDGQQVAWGSGQDADKAWATNDEGVGSWIKLNFEEASEVDALRYANRDREGSILESNKDLRLEFATAIKPTCEHCP